jgi:hypothetical protein
MNPFYLLYASFFFWVIQQVNDAAAAVASKAPRPYWVSWTASFLSGGIMFYFLNQYLHDVLDLFVMIFSTNAVPN